MAGGIYYGLTIRELKQLAYEFAKKISVKYPTSWDINSEASKDWYYYTFMHRHKNIFLRTPKQISANGAKSFCKANVTAFFDNFGAVPDKTNFEPYRIWNMYESGCPTVPTKALKVIASEGSKQVGQKTSTERGTNVSLALAVSAIGQSTPPFYIFPHKNMHRIFVENAVPGAVGIANKSGWMTSVEFAKFMAHFIKHVYATKVSPIPLLIDNQISHLIVEAIDMAS